MIILCNILSYKDVRLHDYFKTNWHTRGSLHKFISYPKILLKYRTFSSNSISI